jgi:hypothetical protein
VRPHVARKLAEVCASYREPHRCGLKTCQEIGECGFPTRCICLPSDLSADDVPTSDVAAFGLRPDGRIMPLEEVLWLQEGEANGWEPPERRPWWKRLWIVRHIGALVLSWRVHTYAGGWAEVGIGIGGPHPQDLWVVEGAYHGYW